MPTHRTPRMGSLALSLFLFAACSDGSPLPTESAPDLVAARAEAPAPAPVRPLTQRSWGTMAPVGPCGGGVGFEASGEGRALHVGRFDIELAWCMEPSTGVVLGGSALVVSASGDEISMDLTGQGLSPAELMMDATIVGGTGRFQGASGELAIEIAVQPSGAWKSYGKGWVSY